MKKTIITVSQLAVLVGVLGIGSAGFTSCKKKEDDVPPAPSAAPAPAPTPTPVAVTTEEEAGVPIVDAGADAKRPASKGVPADVAGLRACCSALQQNAASMPPPNNAFALQAAALCQSLVGGLAAGSTTKAGALGSIGGMLKGANLPPACK